MQVQLPIISNGLTKTTIAMLANEAVERTISNGNELAFAEAISAAEQLIKEIKSNDVFKNCVRSEIEKYGKETKTSSGAKIELAETGTKYDYSQCNDSELIDMYAQLELLKNKVKERENMLKTLPLSGIDIAMQTTGEIVRVYPPAKTSTSSYKITLLK